MIPYDVFSKQSHLTHKSDFRALAIRHSNIDDLVSRGAYRLANAVDRFLFRRGR